jgi:hypothetical protein
MRPTPTQLTARNPVVVVQVNIRAALNVHSGN